MFADAEFGSLLPLNDGTYQVVRGLTMEDVTADMPIVNLTPIMSEIRKRYKDVPEIKDIRVPKKVGGQVDMILGINYAKIFPEPIFTFENDPKTYIVKFPKGVPGNIQKVPGELA